MTSSREPTRGARRSSAATWASVLVVVAVAALLFTLPGPARPDVPTVAPAAEPISRTVLVCPPGREDAVVRAASVAGLPATGEGGVELTVDQPDGEPRTTGLARGDLVATQVDSGAVLVGGAGASARGLLAVRGERVGATLTGAGCSTSRPEWWFTGAGGGVDHASVLFLSNADEGPAVVDVRLHGASGNVDEAGTRGIALAPGETVKVPLAEVAPGSDELTVQVTATRGRVAAHVLDSASLGAGDPGTGREWLPGAAAPADEVVLPGVVADADQVQLLVTNPGEEQALVDLQLLTEDGAFVPLGTEQLSVDPGTVERVDLTEELKGRAAAVRLRSAVPVTGAVRVALDGDAGYATSAEPLESPSGAVLVGGGSELQVAAGDQAVSLVLRLHDARGRQLLQRAITVPPAGLVITEAPAGSAYAVLEPRSGGGYAATVDTRPGLAGRPATPLETTVLRAVVLPWTGQAE